MLRRCVEVMNQAPPSAVLVYPRCETLRDGRILAYGERNSIESRDRRPYRRLGTVLHCVLVVNQLYGLMKADALRKTQLNGPYPSSDYVLLAELAMLGQIREIPEVLLRRRIDSDRGTAAVLHDRKAWQTWLNPNEKKPRRAWLPHRERLALEYLHAAWRLPLKPADRLMCLLSILPVYYGRISAPAQFVLRVTRPLRHKLKLRRRIHYAQSPGPSKNGNGL
jgi:hypothetical protein